MSAVVFIRACEHLSFVLFAFACASDQSYVLTDVCVIIAWHTNGFVFIPLGAYLNVKAKNCFITVEALYKIHIGPLPHAKHSVCHQKYLFVDASWNITRVPAYLFLTKPAAE